MEVPVEGPPKQAEPVTVKERDGEKVHRRSKEEKSSRRKDEKSLDHVLKSLNSLNSSEEKFSALCKKYVELADELKKQQLSVKANEKKMIFLQRERDQLQGEQSKAIVGRSKLESLCRELQKQNKLMKEENLARIKEEEEKRKEVSAKFHTTLEDITSLMQQNTESNSKLRDENLEIQTKFKSVCEQYELREQQVEKISKQMKLESQLSEARLHKAKLEMLAEKEILERDKQQLMAEIAMCHSKLLEHEKTEETLRAQINVYFEKYDEFQNVLNKSNQVYTGFKGEMDKMSKKITRLEKETSSWKQKWESSQKSLLQLSSEKKAKDDELQVKTRQLAQLQKLCRTLQAERAALLQQLKNAGITPLLQDNANKESINQEKTTLETKETENVTIAANDTKEKSVNSSAATSESTPIVTEKIPPSPKVDKKDQISKGEVETSVDGKTKTTAALVTTATDSSLKCDNVSITEVNVVDSSTSEKPSTSPVPLDKNTSVPESAPLDPATTTNSPAAATIAETKRDYQVKLVEVVTSSPVISQPKIDPALPADVVLQSPITKGDTSSINGSKKEEAVVSVVETNANSSDVQEAPAAVIPTTPPADTPASAVIKGNTVSSKEEAEKHVESKFEIKENQKSTDKVELNAAPTLTSENSPTTASIISDKSSEVPNTTSNAITNVPSTVSLAPILSAPTDKTSASSETGQSVAPPTSPESQCSTTVLKTPDSLIISPTVTPVSSPVVTSINPVGKTQNAAESNHITNAESTKISTQTSSLPVGDKSPSSVSDQATSKTAEESPVIKVETPLVASEPVTPVTNSCAANGANSTSNGQLGTPDVTNDNNLSNVSDSSTNRSEETASASATPPTPAVREKKASPTNGSTPPTVEPRKNKEGRRKKK